MTRDPSRRGRPIEDRQTGAVDFYTEVVLPALSEHLDQAFPEFGWRRDARGWVATNQEHTHARLGVRAERVVAHGAAPRGFLVHGGDAMLWTAYVGSGTAPRGEAFISAVRELARRAGVDATPVARATPRDRRSELLQAFIELCRRELISERGAGARAYLIERGLQPAALERTRLGLVPPIVQSREALVRAGYGRAEIGAAGVLADTRWPGRLCGAWTTEHGRPKTLWARTLEPGDSGTRYLYLRGASRTGLPPYGLSDVLTRSPELRRDLVLVEGVFDFHQLQAHGVENVAALGGVSTSTETFRNLFRLGIEQVTLCLDRDPPGRTATERAIDMSTRAPHSPTLLVVDPERLAPSKDPDELVRTAGLAAWSTALVSRQCAITWRAAELLDGATIQSGRIVRRSALSRAGAWLGTLPPRLALEQEDAIRVIAERCGYSIAAVERAFQARYWQERRERRAPGLTSEL